MKVFYACYDFAQRSILLEVRQIFFLMTCLVVKQTNTKQERKCRDFAEYCSSLFYPLSFFFPKKTCTLNSLTSTPFRQTPRIRMDPDSEATPATLCYQRWFNASAELTDYIARLIHNQTAVASIRDYCRREIEGDPVVYIVVVLVFYSLGIVILMINYMKKVRYYRGRHISRFLKLYF